ncbi:MAG: type IV pilus secretin PilQ [Acidobacteriota bacterium]|nr:type IV pilus secretin PilQ [Acidobacteriota bacterium]NLH10806.1 type IV pilus secretin PilQ [Holophagae bacterium]
MSVLGMAWTEKPAQALVISASGPLRFSEARPEPGVVVIELQGAVLAAQTAPITAPEAGLRRATLAALVKGSEGGVQLRLEVEPGASVAVSALPAGLEVRLGAALPMGRRDLADVVPVADATGVSIHLASGRRLEGKVFTLDNPPRVVVDLPGVINRVARRVHPVGAGGVVRVRVAQHATEPTPVVRVAVDLETAQPYTLEPTADGALLRVGAPPEAAPVAVAEATPVPAAAEPEPAEAPEVTAAEPEPALQVAEAAPALTRQTTIVDAPPAPAPKVEPAAPVSVAEPASLVAPPAAPQVAQAAPRVPPADSPWTSTPAALAEEAGQEKPATLAAREVESEEKKFTGEPMTLELKDADVKDVLRTFAKITGLNVVVDPDVSGSVTVQLEHVPWDQALDIILRINNLDYVVENNVLRVARLERLATEKQRLAEFKLKEDDARPMRTVTRTLSYIKAVEARTLLTSGNFLLSRRGTVVVDERNNMLIIRDNADRLPNILALLDQIDIPIQQVIIEARIVETTRTFSRNLGISWGFDGRGDTRHGTTTGWTFPNSYAIGGGSDLIKGAPVLTMAFADILDSFNLDFQLGAAELDGLAKVVSSPKVTAQNNQTARIQSGVMIPIQTVSNNTVTVQYVDATLALQVTPQITAEGTVILNIQVQKREPASGLQQAGGTNTPLITRDAQTMLMVRDGGTTVIGGIYQFSDQSSQDRVPGLHRLPIIGNLFKNKGISNRHDELLIFITPRIVKY